MLILVVSENILMIMPALLAIIIVNNYVNTMLALLTMSNANRRGHSRYGGKFVAVMHPNVMNDLLDDEVLVNKLLVPGNENGPTKGIK